VGGGEEKLREMPGRKVLILCYRKEAAGSKLKNEMERTANKRRLWCEKAINLT